MARLSILSAMMVLAVMGISVSFTVAEAQLQQNLYSLLSGRKFNITNITPDFSTAACPDANPNTISFYPSNSSGPVSNGTVKIVGYFEAAFIGVCDSGGFETYPVPSTTTINYEVDGDWIVFRFPPDFRGPSAVKVFNKKGNVLSTVGVFNFFSVSTLTDAGRAT